MVQNLPVQVWKFVGIFFLLLFSERSLQKVLFVVFLITILKSCVMYSFIFVYNLYEILSLLLTISSLFVCHFSGAEAFSFYEKTDCQVALSYRNITVILAVMWIVSYEELSLLSYRRIYLYLLL